MWDQVVSAWSSLQAKDFQQCWHAVVESRFCDLSQTTANRRKSVLLLLNTMVVAGNPQLLPLAFSEPVMSVFLHAFTAADTSLRPAARRGEVHEDPMLNWNACE